MVEKKEPENSSMTNTQEIRAAGGPLALLIPADKAVATEATRLISDSNLNVEDLSSCVCQDPVIVMDLLKTANAMFFSGGRPPITSPKTAIVRLGQQVVKDTLFAVAERPSDFSQAVYNWIEIHRSRCKRTSIIARMLSEVVIKNFSDECQVAGLLSYVGEMLAVVHFKEEYVRLADEQARASVNYRLAQDHKFDVERMGLNYLRRFGIPEVILFALDREALSRAPERAQMKPVIMAADEMVESFDSNRWDKLAPGKVLPGKSALRLLQISDSQYSRLYERSSEYLFSMRIIEEKRKNLPAFDTTSSDSGISIASSSASDDIASWSTGINISSSESMLLQNEIEGLLDALSDPEPEPLAPPPPSPKPASAPVQKASPTSGIKVSKDTLKNEYGLGEVTKKPARVTSPAQSRISPPSMASVKSAKKVSAIAGTIENATDTESLLKELLGMLVGPGLFNKSALIVVSKDKQRALVVAARGPNIQNGQTLIIDDPLSPLAECFSKVQSFGNKESKVSPFGSKAFAVAPVDAAHDTPVALYADCGDEGAIPFEARRIFRNVIDILNQKLPYLPGTIPIEV